MGVSMSMSLVFALLRLLSGGPNDLLDYMTSEAYWKAKGVTVSLEAMAGELKGTAKADPAGPKAGAVRKLMAIRTLGELKKPQGVTHLKPLLESKEMFVADYAGRAIAEIEGKPYSPAGISDEQRQSDLWLLPKEAAAVGQVRFIRQPGSVDLLLEGAPPQARQKLKADFAAGVMALSEQMGNIRVEGVTAAASSDLGSRSGFAMVVARGQYDSKALVGLLKGKVPAKAVMGVDVFSEGGFHMMFPSDERMVIVGGPAAEKIPLEALSIGVAFNKGTIRENVELTKLVEEADKSGVLWGAAKVKGAYEDVPAIGAFETISLIGRMNAGKLEAQFSAVGTDSAEVLQAVAMVNRNLDNALGDLRQMQGQMPMFDPLVKALETIKCTANGTKATLSGSVDLAAVAKMAPMLFGIRQ